MAMVFFHSRRTTPWMRYLGARLEFADRVVITSEFDNADLNFMRPFYRHLERTRHSAAVVEQLGAAACREIILRCRLLRTLGGDLAHRMVGAMWRTWEEIFERHNPVGMISFMIDHYALDIGERVLRRRGGRYIGLLPSILNGQVKFTARGEHTPVREPLDDEVERAVETITSGRFAPFLASNRGFGWAEYLRLYGYFNARAAAFRILRGWRNDPLNWHYAITSGTVGNYRLRLRDRRVQRLIDRDWRARLAATPFERRVFVALQYNPEASTDYWVRDVGLIDPLVVIPRLARTLSAAGFTVFVKDHPNMFGFRRAELFEATAAAAPVVFVPYEAPSAELIRETKATFTWTGTAGLQAALAGRCAIVCDPYYATADDFLRISSADQIEALPGRIASWRPPGDLRRTRRAIVRRMLRAEMPGDVESWKRFDERDRRCRERAASLIESMNRYIPGLLRAGSPDGRSATAASLESEYAPAGPSPDRARELEV